jgi:hypothetical protein
LNFVICAWFNMLTTMFRAVFWVVLLWTSYSPPWELEISHVDNIPKSNHTAIFCTKAHNILFLPLWKAITCCLSSTDYSVYSHLSIIHHPLSGGLLHLQPKDMPCCGDKGPNKMANVIHEITKPSRV